MSLTQPAWLALLLLAALLVWLARQRHAARTQEVSALHLWRRARTRPPRTRVHAGAALGLQLLALLAAAFALTRPALTTPGPGGTLLLDASAGMRATDLPSAGLPGTRAATRFDAARTLVLRDLGPGTTAAVLTGGPLGGVQALTPARTDPAALRAQLRAAQPGDGPPDWAAAARWAARQGRGPLRVYTSPAQVQAARDALRPLKRDLRVTALGRADTPNAALSDLRVTPAPAGQPWTLRVTARAFGPGGPRTLSVRLAGRVLTRMDLTPQATPTPVTLRFTPGAGGLLSVSLDARDALSADDHAELLLRPTPTPLRITVQGPLPAGSPLDRALKALSGAVVRTADPTVSNSAASNRAAGPVDLLIVTDPQVTAPAPAPLTLLLNADPARTRPDRALAWATDPVTQAVPWASLRDLRAAPLPDRPGAAVTLGGAGGALLTRETTPRGETWRAALPPDGAWTDTPAFPVLLATLAARARPDAGAQVPTPCAVGRPCALPPGPHTLREPGLPERRVQGSFVPTRAGQGRLDGQPLVTAGTPTDLRAPPGPAPDPPPAPRGPHLLDPWRVLVAVALLAVLVEGALRVRAEPALRRPGAWRTPAGRRWWPWQTLAAALLLLATLNPGVRRPLPAPAPVTVTGGGNLGDALADAAARAPGATLRVTGGDWRVPGDLHDTLARLRAAGTPVEVLLAPAAPLSVPVFDVPADAPAGQAIPATLTLRAARPGPVRITVWQGDRAAQQGEIRVPAGLTRLSLPLPAPRATPGPDTYAVTVQAAGVPGVTRHAAVRTAGPQDVLLVGAPGPARDAVVAALAAQGLRAEPFAPQRLTPQQVSAARRVTLLDTPADALNADVRDALAARVRAGAHLLLSGDTRAFGPGGYLGTSLETLSPLSGRVPRDQPRLALALLLDKSGSMNEVVTGTGTVTKLDLIKAAALGSARLLGARSDVTVIAFDSSPKVAVPLGPASRDTLIRDGIARIEAEGGTVVKRALDAALKSLSGSDAPRRHLLLLTDGVDGGIFSPEEYERLIRRIRATGITVSAVTVGSGMHVPLLRRVAEWGGGTFAQAQDWRDVPSLLARDTLAQGRPAARRGRFTTRWSGAPTPDSAGRTATPDVAAAIRTTLKPGATLLGTVNLGQDGAADGSASPAAPLAATWAVGLGRVTALSIHPAALLAQPGGAARLAPLVRGAPGTPLPGAAPDPPALILDGADLIVQGDATPVTVRGPGGPLRVTLSPQPAAPDAAPLGARLNAPTPGLYLLDGTGVEVPPGDAPPADLTAAWTAPVPPRAAVWPLWPALTLAALACFLTALVRRAPRRAAARAPAGPGVDGAGPAT